MNNNPHVAIVGASGAVGVEMIRTLERRNFPAGSLRLLASQRSAGKSLNFRGETLTIEELTPSSFEGLDIALFSAGGGISKEWGPEAVKAGAVVVENVFAIKGLGRVLIQGILNRDYPVVQGAILVVSAIFVFTNLLVDFLYGIIDPRIRYDE